MTKKNVPQSEPECQLSEEEAAHRLLMKLITIAKDIRDLKDFLKRQGGRK